MDDPPEWSMTPGRLIYISIIPLVGIIVPSVVGAVLVRTDKLGPEGIRNAASIQIYGALPCLLFANVVPSINADNLGTVLLCSCMALFYITVGLIMASLIRLVVRVPEHFTWGFLVAGAWSNWGNVPVSIIQTVTSGPPFGKPGQTDLAIAYSSFFILIHSTTFFMPGGAYSMIKRDFTNQHPSSASNGAPRSPSTPSRLRRLASLPFRSSPSKRSHHRREFSDDSQMALLASPERVSFDTEGSSLAKTESVAIARQGRRGSTGFPLVDADAQMVDTPCDSEEDEPSSPHLPHGTGAAQLPTPETSPSRSRPPPPPRIDSTTTIRAPKKSRLRRCFKASRRILRNVLTPPSAGLLLGLIVALVPPLKSLFVPVPGPNTPLGPDGRPWLSSLLSATAYFGASAVPLALIVLGAAFARMNFPRPISALPWAAIVSLAIAKLVLLPGISFFLIKLLVHLGYLSRKDDVLVFVVAYYSTGVSATNQLAIAALICAEKEAELGPIENNIDVFTAHLVVQYIMLPFVGTGVIAMALRLAA